MNVLKQYWMESERGWGKRPDGYSLHLNTADRDAYVKEYWDGMPDGAPETYSRPNSEELFTLEDAEIITKLANSKNGLRFY